MSEINLEKPMATVTKMRLDIVSAEESIFSGESEFIAVMGEMGEIGIYPGHTALLTALKPGHLTSRLAGDEKYFYLSGGILEVQPHIVTVMADTVVRAQDLDEEAAVQAKNKIKQALENKEIDPRQAALQLAEASAQIRVIQELRRTRKR
jgi:F-type H+-transporting ATPase subunit epsilon